MTGEKYILLIVGEEILRSALFEQFKRLEGFKAFAVASGLEALEQLKDQFFDLIIVDLGPKDMKAHDLCQFIRHADVQVPIIITSKADWETAPASISDPGITEYIKKPVRLAALLARVRANIQQFEKSEETSFNLGPYSFRPAEKLLVRQQENKKIRLTEKETSILRYLFRAQGAFVGREELLNEVWGYYSGVTTHTLETHIYRLRQKLGDIAYKPQILITEPGGYRLIP